MTLSIALLGVIVLAALVLFSYEWIPADVTALGVMLALILLGLVPAETAFAGFGSETVMMLLGLLILTAALLRTGVVDLAGRSLLRYTSDNPTRLMAVIMTAAASLSSFFSNTAATAFFLPVTVGLARRKKISPSKLLMPLAFASILASSVTLIGTSTNLVVNGLMVRAGLEPMGMFELSPVGIPIVLAGIAYMLLIGRRLLPEAPPAEAEGNGFGVRPFLTEIVVLPNSPLAGKTLAETGLGRDLELVVLRVRRGDALDVAPMADTRLEAGDVLLVEGQREQILRVKDTAGISIKADVELSDPSLQTEEIGLVEVILLPRSPLIGRTLRGYQFRERHGLQVLGLSRLGDVVGRKLSQIPLRMGDVLLVQGQRGHLEALASSAAIRVLGAVDDQRPNLRRAPLAVLIFVGALAAATFNWLPLPVALLSGAFLAFVTRCITPVEAYREVEWKVLILIGSMLALGAAMDYTGAAALAAGWIVDVTAGGHPLWLLAGFFLLTVALTQPMSNQAAAVVVLPVALQTALQLGLNPRAFAMMIAVAASCSFITPLEPACLMVFGPGRYRFFDFVRVGTLLTVIIFIIAIVLVPLVWPL